MSLRNSNSRWTPAQERKLKQLVRERKSVRLIAHEMDRTVGGIKSRAAKLGLDLSKLPAA